MIGPIRVLTGPRQQCSDHQRQSQGKKEFGQEIHNLLGSGVGLLKKRELFLVKCA